MNTPNPTRDQWLALAERCETAKGPDIELDCLIEAAVNKVAPNNRFTDSLDAITALIGKELPDAAVGSFKVNAGDLVAYAQLSLSRNRPMFVGSGATEALARCAAFCRAKAQGAGG